MEPRTVVLVNKIIRVLTFFAAIGLAGALAYGTKMIVKS